MRNRYRAASVSSQYENPADEAEDGCSVNIHAESRLWSRAVICLESRLIAERIHLSQLSWQCRQREKRLEEEKLRKIKTLGEAADDVDDVSAWINKSRALEESAKAEARAKALKAAQALEEQVVFKS